MYSDILDILKAPFPLAMLYMLYDILSNEIDNEIWIEYNDNNRPVIG